MPHSFDAWTVEDLEDLPDNGMRYELVDGSLVASPIGGCRTAVRRTSSAVPDRAAPDDFVVCQEMGITVSGPYLLRAGHRSATRGPRHQGQLPRRDERAARRRGVVAVERGPRLVTKRHSYAAAGIPQYWIGDRTPQRLTGARLDGTCTASMKSSTAERRADVSDEPFPLTVDLGSIV